MKSASSITLSRSWWKKEAPDGLKKSGPAFDKALGEYEKAEGGLKAAKAEGDVKPVERALEGLTSSGKQVASEAKDLAKKEKDKKKKADLANTEAVMGKPLSKEIAGVRSKIKEILEGIAEAAEEEDEDAGAFGSPTEHAAFIRKWAPKIKRGTVNFALGLPSGRPEEMRFNFHPKKPGRTLANMLKKDAGAKKFTFGKAGTDALAEAVDGEEDVGGRTLCLTIEGRRIPGLAKRVKILLKALGVSAFGKVKILSDGEEIEGASEEDDDDLLEAIDLDTLEEDEDGDGEDLKPRAGRRGGGAADGEDGDADGDGAGDGDATPELLWDEENAGGLPKAGPEVADALARLEADPAHKAAMDAENKLIESLQIQVSAINAAGIPGAENPALEEAQAKLNRLLATKARIDRLAVTSPQAALQSRTLMADLAKEVGAGIEASREDVMEVYSAQQEAKEKLDTLEKEKARIEAMPERTEKERQARLDAALAYREKHDAATAEFEALDKKFEATAAMYSMREALSTGVLSPMNATPLKDDSAVKLIEGYKKDAIVTHDAMKAAGTAEHPDAVAEGLETVIHLRDIGFCDAAGNKPGEDFSDIQYARKLLSYGGAIGGDYFDRADGYVMSGKHLDPDPFGDQKLDIEQRAKKRADMVADAMIDESGQLDPTNPDAEAMIAHVAFSPARYTDDKKGNDADTPMLAKHMLQMQEKLSDPDMLDRANEVLAGVTEPDGKAARILVNKSKLARKETGKVSEMDAKEAVVSGIMTPVYQGEVGSCFATAGVRELSLKDPAKTMEMFSELVTKGTFTPANGGAPIPAVTKLTGDGHPVSRALEFAVATAAARDDEASQRDDLERMLAKGIVEVDDQLTSEDITPDERRRIFDILNSKFELRYDPTLEEESDDGSSTHGVYVLYDISGSKPIRITKSSRFIKRFTKHVLEALDVKKTSRKGKKIARICRSKDMREALTSGGLKPWKLDGGGFPQHSYDAIYGGDLTEEEVLGSKPDAQSDGERAEKLLTELVERFRDNDDARVALASEVHVFNGLANHPSLDKLKGATDAEIAANIETHLGKPAEELAKRELDLERTMELYNEGIEHHPYDTDYQSDFDKAVKDNRPTTVLSASKLNKAIRDSLEPYLRKWKKTELTKEYEEAKGTDDEFTEEKLREKIDEAVEEALDEAESENRARVLKIMRPPEVTVAHCNWGDPEEETYYVVIADPITGEPRFMERDRPGNDYREASEDAAQTWEEVK